MGRTRKADWPPLTEVDWEDEFTGLCSERMWNEGDVPVWPTLFMRFRDVWRRVNWMMDTLVEQRNEINALKKEIEELKQGAAKKDGLHARRKVEV